MFIKNACQFSNFVARGLNGAIKKEQSNCLTN